ncbi:MAG: thiamine diphosphokinase [Bacilli bacterium]
MKSKNKAIIVGASSLNDTSILKKLNEDYYSIACDGGYYHFLKEKIEPDVLVGDFDTLDEKEIKNPGRVFRLNPVKDDTDVFWSIKYLLEQGFKSIDFYGCLGLKIEHTIGNIQLLSYLCDKGIKARMFTPELDNYLLMLKDSQLTLDKSCKGKLSVFSYSEKCEAVSLINLKYPLDKVVLTDNVPLGVSNEFIGRESIIKVEKGKLLLVLPVNTISI